MLLLKDGRAREIGRVSQKVGHVKHCFGLGPEHFYTLKYLVASNKEHILRLGQLGTAREVFCGLCL
jgi:hypothetical protein